MFNLLQYKTLLLLISIQVTFQKNTQDADVTDNGAEVEEHMEEIHMDMIPVGFLPDLVYRDLAWYGINQIQPMWLSTKNRMAAMKMWETTLGRPHIIMETPPLAAQPPASTRPNRNVFAEEASKWSKEQRNKHENLMEVIRTGGNGLTVRTVVSGSKITKIIIHQGNYYECPEGSEPDVETYHKHITFVQKKEKECTNGQVAQLLDPNIDPCIEGEFTPLEYSFQEGWTFCMGSAERDYTTHFEDGKLDCGNKTKVYMEDFLDLCAIDYNVVISYEYFGDEPRKEPADNGTLCLSWNPCRLSYLYRLEPPEDMPAFPSTTENPCDTTSCPECIEGYTYTAHPEDGPAHHEISISLSDNEEDKE